MKNPALKIVSKHKTIVAAARAIGMNRETFRKWVSEGIPLSCALEIEKKSDGEILAEEVLRYWREQEKKVA